MGILRGFLDFLRRLLSIFLPRPSPEVQLTAAAPLAYTGQVGETLERAVSIKTGVSPSGEPLRGQRVRFFVVEGDVRLGGGRTELEAVTGPDGLASTDLTLTSRGYGLVGAELAGRPDKAVFFSGHTDGVTDKLYLYTECCVPAGAGEITVRITALDLNRAPVLGADLNIEAHNRFRLDLALTGDVQEVGNGEYVGTVTTNVAGDFLVLVEDRETYVVEQTHVCVEPGEANSFDFIGTTDPRASEPFGEVDLGVRLLDAFGNPLSPTRIRASVEGSPLSARLVADAAVFRVQAAGYVHVPVLLEETGSDLVSEEAVPFAATWLGDPGLVFEGDSFSTPLYVTPPPDRPADHGTIEIEFDPELVAFDGFEASREGPAFEAGVTAERGKVTVELTSEVAYPAQDFLNGIFIGTVGWACLGEGTSCFGLIGRMSPSTPKWELCVDQKKKLDSCICIRIIYPAGNNAAKDAGRKSANDVPGIVSSDPNVALCCPVLRVEVDDCPLPLAELNGKTGGNGIANTAAQADALFQNSCRKAGCINITMVPFNLGTTKGRTQVGPPGNGTLDPTTAAAQPIAGVHEIGHALGLNHASAKGDPDNLMAETLPLKQKLNADPQCKTIFQTIGSYSC